MKKLLSIIVGSSLGFVLAASVGFGVAKNNNLKVSQVNGANSAVYTLDGTDTDQGSSGYATVSNITQNDVSWKVTGNTTMNPWRIGGKSITNANRTIYNSTSMSYGIASIDVTFGSASNTAITVNSFTLTVASDSSFSNVLDTVTGTYSASSTQSLSPTSGSGWATNSYYKFTFNVTNSTSSNRYLSVSSIAFYEDDSQATLESLAISGSLTTTTYSYGTSWSKSGLTVTGTYSDGTTPDVTSDVNWSYSPASPVLGTTSVTITATIGSVSATYTESVTVSNPSASPYYNGVPYYMYLNNGTSNYYFTGSMVNTYYGATSSTQSDGVSVYFKANGNGQSIYFNDGTNDQYISVSINGTHTNFTYSTTEPSTPWYYNGTFMVYEIDGATFTIGNYGTNTSFSAFRSYYSSNYYVQFELVSSLTAEQFATNFLAIITCDSTGESEPTYLQYSSWSALATMYNDLDSTEQTTLLNADANESGTTVEQAMARYDYIVGKYGTTSYANFIGRTINASTANRMNVFTVNSDALVVITIIASLSSATFGAYYLLKKKKEN